jgi:hypothetical protein
MLSQTNGGKLRKKIQRGQNQAQSQSAFKEEDDGDNSNKNNNDFYEGETRRNTSGNKNNEEDDDGIDKGDIDIIKLNPFWKEALTSFSSMILLFMSFGVLLYLLSYTKDECPA